MYIQLFSKSAWPIRTRWLFSGNTAKALTQINYWLSRFNRYCNIRWIYVSSYFVNYLKRFYHFLSVQYIILSYDSGINQAKSDPGNNLMTITVSRMRLPAHSAVAWSSRKAYPSTTFVSKKDITNIRFDVIAKELTTSRRLHRYVTWPSAF